MSFKINLTFQTFHQMAVGSLPAILRKAMVAKFVDFDEYQLAKYNKGTTKAKKKPTVIFSVDSAKNHLLC